MKFFIDTANLEQIQEAYDLGVLDGVTTNPSLMAKEGIKGTENQREHYIKICKIVNADVSAEVIATDYEGMIREGEELAALNPHIVVKVPCIADGIKAIKYFTEKGIRTNCTLVFSVGQALLAAKAGNAAVTARTAASRNPAIFFPNFFMSSPSRKKFFHSLLFIPSYTSLCRKTSMQNNSAVHPPAQIRQIFFHYLFLKISTIAFHIWTSMFHIL